MVSDMIERSVHHSIEDWPRSEQFDHDLVLYQLGCSDTFVLPLCDSRGIPHPLHFARGTHEQCQQCCVRIDTWLLHKRTERGDCFLRAQVVKVADVRYLKDKNVSSVLGGRNLDTISFYTSKCRLWEELGEFRGVHVEEFKVALFC